MSVGVVSEGFVAERAKAASRNSLLNKPGVAILLSFGLCLALSWPRLVEVWQTRRFYDTDDAMRLVQVRDWLAGQSWYDLTAHRLHPPSGVLMHWSRVVDVPLGMLIRLFETVTGVGRAETLTRIVFPLSLQVCLLAVAFRLGRLLVGPDAGFPTVLLLTGTGFMLAQFPPGRIDHHAPQIVLLLSMTLTLLRALSPEKAWMAGLTALCLALSLAISLENLPFAAVLLALLPLCWVAEPLAIRPALFRLGGALALCVPVLFVATVPPSRYGDVVVDALSIVHVTACLAGAAGFVGLALLSERITTRFGRGCAVALVGAVVAGLTVALFPSCLHGPYANMDPLVRRLWLTHVTEAEPLFKATADRPETLTVLFCPMVVGAVAAIIAAWRESGIAKTRWIAVAALTLVGLAGTLWEVRVATSTQPLAIFGGVWVVIKALRWAERRSSGLARLVPIGAGLPFMALAWSVVPVGSPDAAVAQATEIGFGCRAPTAFAPLAALPPGMIFAPIDDGSHLLVHTRSSVVAAPYHRNQSGNKAVLEGFLAQPAAAEAMVRSTGARYVALCPGEIESMNLAREAPNGLAADLAAGKVPSWLEPLALDGTPYKVFAVR